MSTVRMTLTFSISDETVADMLDAAGYGMTYWAKSMEILTDPARTIIVVEYDENTLEEVERRTNFAGIREAFVKLATPGQQYVGSTVHGYFAAAVTDRDEKTGEIEAGHIDSDAGDCLVQVALFDEVVYG